MLDLVLLLAAAAFAISGYRRGFVVGVLSLVGFLGGAAVGAHFAPELAARYLSRLDPAVAGLIVVLGAATLGQLLAAAVGAAVRRRLISAPVRFFDSAAGAVISVTALVVVAWLLGTAVANSSMTGLARQVQRSRVLTTADSLMPDAARTWFSSFRRLIDSDGLPQVFGRLGGERVVRVPPPDPKVAASAAVRVARTQVVKVVGVAAGCSRQLEGSGFGYAPQRVMTNAHVLAGVRRPRVQVGGVGPWLSATVVLYDSDRDVAVLAVPGLRGAPLRFAGPAPAGGSAVVAGYPQNGPFRAEAARIRDTQTARGPDIYHRTTVTRSIYSVRALVRPGNSGGPLLAPDGRVYGVVFAAGVADPTTGYALTAAEVGDDARAGATATATVGTGGCD